MSIFQYFFSLIQLETKRHISISSPNFLILDEPTNHLGKFSIYIADLSNRIILICVYLSDMETIEALGEALNKFTVSKD